MRSTPLAIAIAGVVLLLSQRAQAQAPFFNGGVGIFDPEISVVQSGVILDAQAVVSADRKYVTLTTRLQNAQLLNLSEFAFQTGGQPGGVVGGGAVGNVAANGANAEGRSSDGRSSSATSGRSGSSNTHTIPSKAYPAPGKANRSSVPSGSILDKEGMTLVGKVEPARIER
jgi:hypothetical protein